MERDENGTFYSRLKITHLLWPMVIFALFCAVALGALMNQQKTNGKAIEKKVEKEVFEAHATHQTQQFNSIQTSINKGFDKIETRLNVMQKVE